MGAALNGIIFDDRSFGDDDPTAASRWHGTGGVDTEGVRGPDP